MGKRWSNSEMGLPAHPTLGVCPSPQERSAHPPYQPEVKGRGGAGLGWAGRAGALGAWDLHVLLPRGAGEGSLGGGEEVKGQGEFPK